MGLFGRKKKVKENKEEISQNNSSSNQLEELIDKKQLEESMDDKILIEQSAISKVWGEDFVRQIMRFKYDFASDLYFKKYIEYSFPKLETSSSLENLNDIANKVLEKYDLHRYAVIDNNQILYKETIENIIRRRFILWENDLVGMIVEEHYPISEEMPKETKDLLQNELIACIMKNIVNRLYTYCGINSNCLKGILNDINGKLQNEDNENTYKDIFDYLYNNYEKMAEANSAYFAIMTGDYMKKMLEFLIRYTYDV